MIQIEVDKITPLSTHSSKKNLMWKQLLTQLENNLFSSKAKAALIWPENEIAVRANEIQRQQHIIPQTNVSKLSNWGQY